MLHDGVPLQYVVGGGCYPLRGIGTWDNAFEDVDHIYSTWRLVSVETRHMCSNDLECVFGYFILFLVFTISLSCHIRQSKTIVIFPALNFQSYRKSNSHF